MEVPGYDMCLRSDLKGDFDKGDLERLKRVPIVGVQKDGFKAVFACIAKDIWEGHWFSELGARETIRSCKEVLRAAQEQHKVKLFLGMTNLKNKDALRVVKILGFTPVGFKDDWNGEPCLLTFLKEVK